MANALADFHALPVPEVCAGEPMLWRTIDKMMEVWADLGEDKMINLATGFGRFSALRGPRGAPGAPGTAPARKIVQVASKIRPGDLF